jgi:hypothetical protein
VRPDGRAFDSVVPGGTRHFDWARLPQLHREGGIRITRDTAVTRWRGERMDYSIATEILLSKARKPGGVPAGM